MGASSAKPLVTRLRVTRRRALFLVMVALVLLAWWVDALGQWCRMAARRSLQNNRPQATLTWIGRSRRVSGSSGETFLLAARCYARAGLTAQAIHSLGAAASWGATVRSCGRARTWSWPAAAICRPPSG